MRRRRISSRPCTRSHWPRADWPGTPPSPGRGACCREARPCPVTPAPPSPATARGWGTARG
eukprot:scaffold57782_cov63-Phaeocystis_antarctica.AAC.4